MKKPGQRESPLYYPDMRPDHETHLKCLRRCWGVHKKARHPRIAPRVPWCERHVCRQATVQASLAQTYVREHFGFYVLISRI